MITKEDTQRIAKKEIAILKSLVGARFVYRTVEILGPECANKKKPPFEGQDLTIVGVMPRYVNNVVVQAHNGREFLMPMYMAQKALSQTLLQVGTHDPNKEREVCTPRKEY
jgi:hypothetical protein